MPQNGNRASNGVGFWQIVQSVLAAGLGVQSQRRREEDFGSSHSPFPYIVGGIIFTGVFVGLLLFFVKVAIS